jgi:DNA-binding phage protein
MDDALVQVAKALNKSSRSVGEIASAAGVARNTVLNLKNGNNTNPVILSLQCVAAQLGLKIVAVKR